MINIDITPQKIQIEIAGYGQFEVTPLGAGAEAALRIAQREMNELLEKVKEYGDAIKGDDEKLKEEAMEAVKEANKALDSYRDMFIEKMRRVFKGAKADKLFEDFTEAQLNEIYHKALTDGRAA